MNINEVSKTATRKQLSFKIRDLIYTPDKGGFKRSDGLKMTPLQMWFFSLKNPDLKATWIEG